MAYFSALSLSLYSAYTTWGGFANFTRETFGGPVIAILPTVGIQIMLVIAAFMFGRQLRYVTSFLGFLKKSGWLVLCLFAMFCSVFFSFDSVFSQLTGPQYRQQVAMDTAARTARGFLEDVRNTVDDTVSRIDETIKQQSEDFVAAMRKIEQLGESAREKLNARLRDEAKQRQEAEARRQAEIQKRAQRLAAAKRELTAVQSTVQSLKSQISQLEAELDTAQTSTKNARNKYVTKQREVDELYDEAQREAGGAGRSGNRAGKGPKYRELMAKHRLAQQQARALKTVFERAKRKSDELARSLTAMRQKLEAAEVRLEELNVRIRTERLDVPEIAAQSSQPASPRTTINLAQFNQKVTDFEKDPAHSSLKTLTESCIILKTELQRIGLDTSSVRGACKAPGLEAKLKQKERLVSAQLVLAKEGSACDPKQVPLNSTFQDSVDAMTKCLQASSLDERAKSDLEDRLSTLKRERSETAHPFYFDYYAIKSGDTMAILALIIAIGVDALVLISGLLGERASFSPLARRGLAEVSDLLDIYPASSFESILEVITTKQEEHFVGFVDSKDLARFPHMKQILLAAGNRTLKDGTRLVKATDAGIWLSQIYWEELAFHWKNKGGVPKGNGATGHRSGKNGRGHNNGHSHFHGFDDNPYHDNDMGYTPDIIFGEALETYSSRRHIIDD